MSEVAVVGKVEYATGQHVPKQDAFAIAAVVPIIHQEEDCPEQTNIGGGCSYEGCKHVQDISGMSGGTFLWAKTKGVVVLGKNHHQFCPAKLQHYFVMCK